MAAPVQDACSAEGIVGIVVPRRWWPGRFVEVRGLLFESHSFLLFRHEAAPAEPARRDQTAGEGDPRPAEG